MELLERGPILEQLHSLLNDAEHGKGSLVAIAGEAGIGKSVLIRYFCEAVSNRADVFIGACDPLSTPTPLGPVLDIAPELGSEFEDLLQDFETKLRGYDQVWFYHNPGRFHPLYKRLIQRASLKTTKFTHLPEVRNV